jgi:hypothetical protein
MRIIWTILGIIVFVGAIGGTVYLSGEAQKARVAKEKQLAEDARIRREEEAKRVLERAEAAARAAEAAARAAEEKKIRDYYFLASAVCQGKPFPDAPPYTRTPGRHVLHVNTDRPSATFLKYPNATQKPLPGPELVLCSRWVQLNRLATTCKYTITKTGEKFTTGLQQSKTVYEIREAATGELIASREVMDEEPNCESISFKFEWDKDPVQWGDPQSPTQALYRWLDSYVILKEPAQ